MNINYQTISVSITGKGVCLLSLNRPRLHNAFNELMIQELTDVFTRIQNDATIRVVVFRGTGKSFCAGADLKWMQRMAKYDDQQNYDDALKFAKMMDLLYRLSKPTITVAHGAVFGGGVGLVACCDIAIAERSTIFSLSEVKLGLVPAVISPYVAQAIGIRQAHRYFLSGEKFSAVTAKQIGLIHDCGLVDELQELESHLLNELVQSAPAAQATAKSIIQDLLAKPIDFDLQEETARIISGVRAKSEAKEGMTAFFEKRKPSWQI